MSDDKKRDDYAIHIGDREPGERFGALPSRSVPAPSSGGSAGIFSPANQGVLSILSYCASSILMTTTNKYVLSGLDYNLNFLLLAVQVREYLQMINELMLIDKLVNRLRAYNSVGKECRLHHLS